MRAVRESNCKFAGSVIHSSHKLGKVVLFRSGNKECMVNIGVRREIEGPRLEKKKNLPLILTFVL